MGSLLDLAEGAGLSPEYSCRGGSCGTCKTRLHRQAVALDPYKTSLPTTVGDIHAAFSRIAFNFGIAGNETRVATLNHFYRGLIKFRHVFRVRQ